MTLSEASHALPPGMSRRSALKAVAGLAAAGVGFGAIAQPGSKATAGWSPKGAVRIIVPFAAGGTSDIIARIVAVRLGGALGQSVVVENRAGAGGNIGIAAVARAAPDGQTLLFVSSSFVTNPALFADKRPYDPLRQFAPITLAVSSPDVIVVPSKSGIVSLPGLIESARKRPGELTYSTPGKGNSVHLGGELLWQRAGVSLLHVPFNGAAPAVQAVLSGQVDCGLTALPAAKAHIAAGSLRVLAVGGLQRWPGLPQAPTVAESGFPGYRSETIQALFAPSGAPDAAILRLHTEVYRILQSSEVRQQARDLGFEVVASQPTELAARVAEEVPRWAEVATRARIQSD
ncbi:tripartite tricarboxylate transporter substrate binding protein [Cupriavidus sp. NPDC089707]|uniref:tripartite tricarboxylate transporter substrate binding protein n=1 Tax=Cupriavidus sp. NPDC089707 TaxID=3363963 RepID=UPI00381F0856